MSGVSRILPLVLCLSGCTAGVDEPTVRDDGELSTRRVTAATVSGVLDEPFTLVDGEFEGEPFVAGASARPTVRTLPASVAISDLDGDGAPEGTLLLAANTGGSGAFVHLVIVALRDGSAESVATAMLGDRTRVRSFGVEGGRIVIETTEHGELDPMCCPTETWRREWEFRDGVLANVASTRQDYAESVQTASISASKRYRGHVVWGHEARTFSECGGEREAWISNVNASGLVETWEALATQPYQPIFMEVEGMMLAGSGPGFAADFDHSMVVVQVLRAEREGFGCDEDLAGVRYRARGNEPSWRVDVREDVIELNTMDGASGYPVTDVRTGFDAVTIVAEDAGSTVELVLRRERCTDSMSGSVFEYSAAFSRGESPFSGCAVRGE